MSDTESFESVMEAAMPLLSGDCVFESCPDEHDDCMHCAIHMADRLRRAHDREIAQARDPQRLRGTKPDTFNGAIEALREFRWQHATNDEDAIPYINAVKEMHDREIRDTAQQQFARGFNAGQHSMDADHRAVAMRLRGLRFDGGSHENLSRIAYAIYPCATGWTCESADGLRDKLIDLLGGVSDDTCGAECCCTAADCDGDCGLQREEVSDSEYSVSDSPSSSRSGGTNRDDSRSRGCRNRHHTPPKELEVSDGGTADDSASDSRGGSDSELVHMAGLTDELREWMSTVLTSDDYAWSIADRIDAQFDRICEQQEAVLQSTIDGMVKEYEHDRLPDQLRIERLVEQRDEARAERDELQEKLDAIRDALDG